MMRNAPLVYSLAAFAAVLLALGVWAARRTHTAADFVIANRRLGAWLTALGYSGGMLSPPLLLVMSAAGFVSGFSAVWLWIAVLAGAALNLFYIAPRLRFAATGQGAVTVIQVLSADSGERLQPAVMRSIAVITIAMLLLLAGAALRTAGAALSTHFGLNAAWTAMAAGAVVGICIFAGGLRAVAACDAAQGVLMTATALLLLVPVLAFVGGVDQLGTAFASLGPSWADVFAGKSGVVAFALVAGGLGVGLAMCGQPQALNRFIAVRDERTFGLARWLALGWIAVASAAPILSGWAAAILYSGLEPAEFAMFALALRPLPLWLGSLFAAALVTALVCALGAPVLTIASTLAVDLRRGGSLVAAGWLKTATACAAAAVVCVGALAPGAILDHALYAFTTLGAALGPLLLVRLSGKRIRPGSTLGALWSAFALSTLFHLLPDSPGDFLERVLPFVAALGVALSGGERRRNPDRADRSQETVHDRIPI